MGCLKLTYDYQEQGEKNDSLDWRVWVNPNADFLGVVDQQYNGSVPNDPTANNGLNWTDAAGGVISSFGLGTDISLYQITKGGMQVSLASKGAYVGAKAFGNTLGAAGLAITGYDIYDQGLNTSRTLDVVMGGVAFIPVVGWGISATYFVGNLITIGVTGQSIGDHIQGSLTGQNGSQSWKPWGN